MRIMRASQSLALSYLRNMKAAQDNAQADHGSYLFAKAMEWLGRDEQQDDEWSGSAVRFSLGIGLDTGTNPTRRENEDYAFADRMLRSLPGGVQETVGIFVVADGVGGSINGQEASRLAVHAFVDAVYPRLIEEPLHGAAVKDLLVEGVRKANEAVYERNQDVLLLGAIMGTTLVSVVSVGTEAYVTGVGDSRVYLYREGKLKQLTQDHSLVAAKVRLGEITPEQVFTHPQRNVIYRALGEASVEIDEPISLHLQNGDVLLLCSDGLWEMVRDPQGGDIAKILADEHLSAEEMAEQLVQLALSGGGPNNIGGGHDNVGIVVARTEVDIAECETLIFSPSQVASRTLVNALLM
ncbi:MAG: serine/threonine-protein phosphatase [Ktedonobacteraceae bacterium]|nr:serine/threonine-protein phosphatase [Ktedonobacteraceae bacterium]